MVSETWLSDSINSSLLDPANNYDIYRADRDKRGGGSAVLISKYLPSSDVSSFSISNCTVCIVDIFCRDNSTCRIFSVYRPPDLNTKLVESQELLDAIEPFLYERDYNLIAGDLNYHIVPTDTIDSTNPDLFTDTCSSSFRDFLLSNNLSILNSDRTYSRSTHLLDLVCCDHSDVVSDIALSAPIAGSDHCSIEFSLNLKVSKNLSSTYVNYHSVDYDKVSASFFHSFYDLKNFCTATSPIQDDYDLLLKSLRSSLDPLAPTKVRHRKGGPPAHITRAKTNRDNLFSSSFSSDSDRILFEQADKRFNKACRDFEVNAEKRAAESDNPKVWYSFVKSKTSSHSSSIDRVINPVSKLPVTDNHQIANCFADYFYSVYKCDDNRPSPAIKNFPESFPASPNYLITEEMVQEGISALSWKTSQTPEGIPSFVIKKLSRVLVRPLCLLFNKSLFLSEIPSQWRFSIVAPLLKKSPKTSVCNYRPVSLTSSFCKVLEQILKKIILKQLDRNRILSNLQFGFLKGRSTSSQLLLYLVTLLEAKESESQVNSIYLDYAKAFDTVSHRLLLYKMEFCGISPLIINWTRAYLSNRTFKVNINGAFSHSKSASSGVPQGSVLGPLLFLIFINDVTSCISNDTKLLMYADDLKVMRTFPSTSSHMRIFTDRQKFQNDLLNICNWSSAWDMQISETKCQHLQVGDFGDMFLNVNSLIIDPIEESETIRDLGVLFSPSLSFSSHISTIVAKASKTVCMLLKSISYPNINSYRKAYISFCRSLLEYCSVVWSPYLKKDIDLIEGIQRRFTKHAYKRTFGVTYNDVPNYEERLRAFNLKSLQHRRIMFDLVECYKAIKLPLVYPMLRRLFVLNNRPPRNSHSFIIVQEACDYAVTQHSFKFRVTRLWNVLPAEVVARNSIDGFKSAIDNLDLVSLREYADRNIGLNP